MSKQKEMEINMELEKLSLDDLLNQMEYNDGVDIASVRVEIKKRIGTYMDIKERNEKLKKRLEEETMTPRWNCNFHPKDGWHENGCPHREWSKEEIQKALIMAKASSTVNAEFAFIENENANGNQLEPLVRQLPKEEFVRRCCEMMEIDEATSLPFAGITDLLENIYEQYFERQSA
jgi:hypothetical protein